MSIDRFVFSSSTPPARAQPLQGLHPFFSFPFRFDGMFQAVARRRRRRRATECRHFLLRSRKNEPTVPLMYARLVRLTVEGKTRCTPFQEEISNLPLSVKERRKKGRRMKGGAVPRRCKPKRPTVTSDQRRKCSIAVWCWNACVFEDQGMI